MQVVVVGVLGHTAVEEGPCQIVHGVLLVLHGLGDDLGVEMVMEAVVQVRLHWQRLVQELLEEVLSETHKETIFALVLPLFQLSKSRPGTLYLLGALTHDHTASLIILHGPVRLAHHLEDVIYGIVHVSERKKESGRISLTEQFWSTMKCETGRGGSLRMNFAIVVLGVHDNNKVCRDVDAPAE